jgi:predicted Zn-ribbon and HTH transcriptional regulator
MPTHRQRIAELITECSWTLNDLSVEVHLSVKEVLQHLIHVRKSVRPPLRFVIEPAGCLNCGFVFKDRRRLNAPSRCPKCRSSHIQDPVYNIEKS